MERLKGYTTLPFHSTLRVLHLQVESANDRDAGAVRIRLEEIKAILGDTIESSVDTMFGGSVAKHTYVDGISCTSLDLI